jgi:hypothetical protein
VASGVIPNTAATSLASMVLTRSTSLVLRIIRGEYPHGSRTWLR